MTEGSAVTRPRRSLPLRQAAEIQHLDSCFAEAREAGLITEREALVGKDFHIVGKWGDAVFMAHRLSETGRTLGKPYVRWAMNGWAVIAQPSPTWEADKAAFLEGCSRARGWHLTDEERAARGRARRNQGCVAEHGEAGLH